MLKSKQTQALTIAIVEFGASHDECLFSQVIALKTNGCRVILACNEKLLERNPHFSEHVDEVISIAQHKNGKYTLRDAGKVMRQVKRKNVDKIVFNTAQGPTIRNACLYLFFSRIECIGIMHTIAKFKGSVTQWTINLKMRKYLVLSEHLKSQAEVASNIQLEYFYPLRFTNTVKYRPQDRTEVTLIGGVEQRRKDLDGFLRMIKGNNETHFTFLGKSDPNLEEVKEFNRAVAASEMASNVHQFDHFVDEGSFIEQLEKTDAILMLIHPGTQSAEEYNKERISGAANVAYAHKIPLLVHEGYKHVVDMQAAAIYYNEENFGDVLNGLKSTSKTVREAMMKHEEYQVEFQEARYARFVVG